MSNFDQSLPWGWIAALVILVTIIDLVLRGIALWRSARTGHSAWFICLLIFNTVGILPAIYLLLHRNASSTPA